jgi:filamentous hemagglutinin
LGADLYNRQLHPEERKWAKDNASKFAEYYQDQTGQTITADQAQQMLLASGYRLVDDASSAGPAPDGSKYATAFISQNAGDLISQNAGDLFTATAAERANPGILTGSLTPEQEALPGAVPNPTLGLAIATGLASPALLPALASIPGAPIFGIDGALGSTAWTSAAGTGAISAGINAGSQYIQNGSINPVDVAAAFGTGAAGTYGGFLWNVAVNAFGGAASTVLNNLAQGKNDSVLYGAAVNGAAAAFGYGVGKGVEVGIGSLTRPTINSSGWADVGTWSGASGWNLIAPNNWATIGAGIAGGSGSEAANAAINGVKNQIGQKK